MSITIKPTQKAIKNYYELLKSFKEQNVDHESAIRSAFQRLLEDTAKPLGWVLVPELSDKTEGKTIRPDGTIRDQNNLPRGYWESKDTHDDLEVEIAKKTAKRYPLTNTIFEDTRQAVLFQNNQRILKVDDLTDAQKLCDLLNLFYSYTEPGIVEFEKAVEEFQERVPDLAKGLDEKIKEAHRENPNFQESFDTFFALCQKTLNPNLREEAVDEMLVQHLLTERLIRTIFDNPEFANRNVIASEVERVITALVSKSFNRKDFLASLDRFYIAIEMAARQLTDFTEKQHFLNSVYERFFQGYSVKVADTHGIVYTPQPVVDFMSASVEEALKQEFGKSLSDPDVFIIDPCTGTGNFIVNLMRRIPKRDLPRMYKNQLFANEVMLLPYYIASLNIEHAYYELTGNYVPFEGLCFVDTLELAEGHQAKFDFMTEKNTERVERQCKSPITVVIGNPPYNMGQLNQNDNNKNREYPVIEMRIHKTYARDSKASLKNKLADAYVKFFRWAVDRLEDREGIVCLITNNSFVDKIAFDGMRKHLLQDFTRLYHVDLHGNVRKNPKLSGTTHNIFGIQVGVGITVAVRSHQHRDHSLSYYRVPENWRKEEKLEWLLKAGNISGVQWKSISPNSRQDWITIEHEDDFRRMLLLGDKESKSAKTSDVESVFKIYSLGVNTARDSVVFDFDHKSMAKRVKQFIEDYNSEVDRFRRSENKLDLDNFVKYDKIKWSEGLKARLSRGNYASFGDDKIRTSQYRPFCRRYLFFDRVLNERVCVFPAILPTVDSEKENLIIAITGIGSNKPFHALMINMIPCLDLLEKTQCFPLLVYDEDGQNRKENISDWTLRQFQNNYPEAKISKEDIFYYVYGMLHHQAYREKFKDNFRREFPRIPLAPDFKAFTDAGKKLADLHLNYEKIEPYKLKWLESDKLPLSKRVSDKMRLSKDKRSVQISPSLTLAGVPPEAFDYRLGNRSALEWVIDQYQVKTDDRTGIKSDPNRYGDEDYIMRLVGQVIAVSVETVKIINSLPEDFGA